MRRCVNFFTFLNQSNAAFAALFAMSLTLSDVKRIANLAQLDMDEAHAETALGE
jgi:hypothetical protein